MKFDRIPGLIAIDPLYRRNGTRMVAAYGIRKQLVGSGNPTSADLPIAPGLFRAVDEQETGSTLLREWIAEDVAIGPMGRCRSGPPNGVACQAADNQAVSNRARVRVS